MDQPAALELPHLRHLHEAKMFAIDVGGSLAKIAYFSNVPVKKPHYADNKIVSSSSGRLHFAKFEARQLENCLNFIREQGPPTEIRATGGGSHRRKELIQKALGPQCKIYLEDEMKCIVNGANFLLRNIPHEVFSYEKRDNFKFKPNDTNVFPYLLVNIGSGVSIIKVESETSFERIGGSALGGASFWGLGSLLTGTRDFDELLQLAEQGDHRSVDTLIGDIYGSDYVGLSADTIACSFGKLSRVSAASATNNGGDNNNIRDNVKPADLARSLLLVISNDIGQLASLYALSHNLDRVYFGGYFLRSRPLSMHTLSFAVNFWSKAKVEPLFLRHEGYLGAIGAYLAGDNSAMISDKVSWAENYACSSLAGVPGAAPTHLEMDLFEWPMVSCPLLKHPEKYTADTVDLTKDAPAREYWLDCFENAINKFVEVAVESQKDKIDAKDRGQAVREKYLEKIKYLRRNPCVYGSLTVRSLLDMREQCLLEFDFADPYMVQKRNENQLALGELNKRITELDLIADDVQRQSELVLGLLAGNVFDYGAKEVVRLLQEAESQNETFGFEKANSLLQKRPWLVDHLDKWLERFKSHVHKCAAIFVDNCGADFVLGVVPFARELVRRGTRVLLCANARPVLNDVTYDELRLLAEQIASICPVWNQALRDGRIKLQDSGQSSPCLDLARIKRQTADELAQCDLLVIEGMGRAIHTNFNTEFTCDSIRGAVIKNKWLAKRLGGDMFSVVFKFEAKDNVRIE